jgi:hypothetical protein
MHRAAVLRMRVTEHDRGWALALRIGHIHGALQSARGAAEQEVAALVRKLCGGIGGRACDHDAASLAS